MRTAKLLEIFKQLEALLDGSDINEGWSDWLRECEGKLTQASMGRQRIELLCNLRASENALGHLRAFLRDGNADRIHPQRQLDDLISLLDRLLLDEIDANQASSATHPVSLS